MRSLTPSTNRSTASTPCFAAVAPCCKTDVATRLTRVTGEVCLLRVRPPLRFAAVLRVAPDRAPAFVALFRRAPDAFLDVLFGRVVDR